MKSYLLITAAIFTLYTSCAVKSNVEIAFQFKELTYGVLDSKKTVSNLDDENKSPSGSTVYQKELSVKEKTNTFKGEKDLIFGVQFIVNFKDDVSIPIRRVWTFPKEITMPSGKKVTETNRTDVVYTNRPTWMYYTIEDKAEIVPGKWTIQYFYKDIEVFSKSFIMQ